MRVCADIGVCVYLCVCVFKRGMGGGVHVPATVMINTEKPCYQPDLSNTDGTAGPRA